LKPENGNNKKPEDDMLRPFKNSSKLKNVNRLLHASSIGISFVVSIVIGTYAGYWLDRKFDTKPVLTIILMLCGVAAGFRNMIYFMKKAGVFDSENDENNK
jgi:ATP synthase protein I